MPFYDAGEIYQNMKTRLADALPGLDGPVVNGLLRVVAAAIGILSSATKWTYLNIFPQYADRETLRRMYSAFGLTWDDSVGTEEARRVILSLYRHPVGTDEWFRQAVLENFSGWVSDVRIERRRRGPTSIDLVVSYHGESVPDSIVAEIQDFLLQPQWNIAGVDVKVRSV